MECWRVIRSERGYVGARGRKAESGGGEGPSVSVAAGACVLSFWSAGLGQGERGLSCPGLGASVHPTRTLALFLFQICPMDGSKKPMRKDKCFLSSKCPKGN